jgi:DNA-binding MarR family transcriptional regulator
MTDKIPVLVTGGAGYIGSHAVLALQDAGWPVAVVDNLVTGFRFAVPEGVPFYEGDIADSALLARIFAEQGTQAILHSMPGTTQSEAGRLLDIQRANMVPIVSRLEGRGLIDRQKVDGRSQGLHLSAKGDALCAEVREEIEAYELALLAGLPDDMRESAVAVLDAFWRAAEALNVEAPSGEEG